MKVSVIIPTYNEADFIESVIQNLADQDFPQEDWEVLIVDGMSTDSTRSLVQGLMKRYSWLKLIDNPDQYVPQAMNIGIKASQGNTIVRMDAHSRYPSNYVSRLLEVQQETGADNVGGVLDTIPGKDTTIAKAIALAMSHPFGIGNAEFRLENRELREVDTVPFGCFPKALFDRIGLYDEDLIRNQDDELNGRLIAAGGRIILIPDLVLSYSARPTWAKMNKMFYQYGFYKPLVNKKLGKPATWRQFIPPAFVLVGMVTILSVLFTSDSFIQLVLTLIYALTALGIALSMAVRKMDFSLIFLLPITFFLIHLSYGCGYWMGIWKFLVLGGKSVDTVSSR